MKGQKRVDESNCIRCRAPWAYWTLAFDTDHVKTPHLKHLKQFKLASPLGTKRGFMNCNAHVWVWSIDESSTANNGRRRCESWTRAPIQPSRLLDTVRGLSKLRRVLL